MFSNKEQELFLDNVEKLTEESEELTDDITIPSREDKKKMMDIIKDYIISHNMVIYGGNAQNLAVKRIDPKGVFYEEGTINDFDTYSSEPIQDIINLCNLIYKAGYKNVRGVEAIHVDTYSIKYNEYTLCDMTYMPKYIIDNVKTYIVDGFRIIDPYFSYIDFMRMFSDPLKSSSFRWEKHFKRFNLLQKYYPLEGKYNKIETEKSKILTKDIKKIVKNFLKKSETAISIGLDCYNLYTKLSLLKKDKIPLKKYTIITSNYLMDTYNIYDSLKLKYKDRITKKEKYPFFQFWDVSCIIYLDNIPIINIYRNNNICIQYKEYKDIKYASFTTNLMWLMIENVYHLIYDKTCSGSPTSIQKSMINNLYTKLIQNMLYMRDLYLKKHKKTILDNTMFQHFVLNCSGIPIPSNDIKKNIPHYIGFKYDPSNKLMKEFKKSYMNISGRFMTEKHELIIP